MLKENNFEAMLRRYDEIQLDLYILSSLKGNPISMEEAVEFGLITKEDAAFCDEFYATYAKDVNVSA